MGVLPNDATKQIREEVMAETAAAMAAVRIDANLLMRCLRQELSAKVSKVLKFKGKVEFYPEDAAGKKAGKPILAPGVKVIAQGVKNEIAKDGEIVIPYDDGDTVIEVREVAWDIRQKARQDAQKLLAMYPVEVKKIQFDEATLNAILRGLPAGVGEAVRAELTSAISAKRD